MLELVLVAALLQEEDCVLWRLPVEPPVILAEVKARKARAVVAELWCGHTPWFEVMTSIERGDRAWLEVAAALEEGTDGGASYDLGIAISRALPHNPRGVLKRFGASPCGGLEAAHSRADAIDLLNRQERMVTLLSDPKLVRARTECLAAIRTTRRDLLPIAQFEK